LSTVLTSTSSCATHQHNQINKSKQINNANLEIVSIQIVKVVLEHDIYKRSPLKQHIVFEKKKPNPPPPPIKTYGEITPISSPATPQASSERTVSATRRASVGLLIRAARRPSARESRAGTASVSTNDYHAQNAV
jgi:hypothetical protein